MDKLYKIVNGEYVELSQEEMTKREIIIQEAQEQQEEIKENVEGTSKWL